MRFAVGFLIGWLTSVPCYLFWQATQEPTAAEAGRAYTAYRACIQRSSCQMTPQDWIDYYELKWRLEESEVERTE
jgi:hypothetical protein